MANDLFLIFLSILHDVAVPRGCNPPAASSSSGPAGINTNDVLAAKSSERGF